MSNEPKRIELKASRVTPGVNDLATCFPKIAAEWHPTKNGDLTPDAVAAHSGKKVWWQCEQGHEWPATVYSRTSGKGCPICHNRKIIPGVNDLAFTHPDIAKEWHPTKNGELLPSQISYGSKRNVWWQCEQGHEWQTTIYRRTNEHNCIYCVGKKPIVGENDFQTRFPEQAKQWHPFKNGDLKPSDVFPYSEKKVWWLCEKGHEWDTTVGCRANGYGCPVCSNQRLLKGENDFQTRFPEQAKQWHPFKNGDLKPSDVFPYSEKEVWWLCEKGHEWQAPIRRRTSGNNCPICSGRKVLAGFNDLATTKPELAAEWHPTKNADLLPSHVTKGSNKKVWWQCADGHEWDALISSRTQGSGCPYCAGQRPIIGKTDLQTRYPDLINEWNYQRNAPLMPFDVTDHSGQTVWWICKDGHEWQSTIKNRATGNGCPYCSNRLAIIGETDLQTCNPELAKQWHPTKNVSITPFDVTIHSNEKVWWKCDKGHEWRASVNDRQRGANCPRCAGKKVIRKN